MHNNNSNPHTTVEGVPRALLCQWYGDPPHWFLHINHLDLLCIHFLRTHNGHVRILQPSVRCQADRALLATVAKTKELKKHYGVHAKRESFSSVLEALSRASGSPFSVCLEPRANVAQASQPSCPLDKASQRHHTFQARTRRSWKLLPARTEILLGV